MEAAEDRNIPPSLYELYRGTNFLSFGKAPRFLSDGDHLLFSYFGLILRSIPAGIRADSSFSIASRWSRWKQSRIF